jgi:hypothetical protein
LKKSTDELDVQSQTQEIHQSHNLVEFQAMQIIVQLPFDASQKDLLKALSSIEGLQRPLRRSEKQCLNELQ